MAVDEQLWQETNLEVVDEEYEDWGKGRQRIRKPPPGTSIWRIFPPRRDAPKPTPFKVKVYVHFIKDPSTGEFIASGICPSKTRGEKCLVCPYISQLRKTGNAADEDMGKGMAAKERIICGAIQLDAKDPKPEILEVPVDPYKTLNAILRDRTNGMDFTHPLKGRNVIFDRTGTTKNDTRYTARLALKDSAIPNMAWLNELPDLEKAFEELDQVSVAKRLAGELPAREAPAADRAPTGRQVEGQAGGGALPPIDGGDLVEDVLSGEMISPTELARRKAHRAK